MKRAFVLVMMFLLSINLSAAGKKPFLADGFYIYSHKRINTFVDIARQYEEMGMTGGVTSLETYTDVLIRITNGVFSDPVAPISLQIDSRGRISSPENSSVQGEVSRNGKLFWTGTRDHYGSAISMETEAELVRVSPEQRAPSSLNGVYSLREEIFEREMSCIVKDGYMFFEPLEPEEWDEMAGEGAVLVKPDGTFSCEVELIIRTETGFYVDAEKTRMETIVSDSSTIVLQSGRVSEKGLEFSFYSNTGSAVDSSQEEGKKVFAGIKVAEIDRGSEGESSSSGEVRTDVPDWYLLPPSDEDYLYAAGARSSDNPVNAVRAAETAAAAQLALQLKTRIEALLELVSSKDLQETLMSLYTETTLVSFNFEVVESLFRNSDHTAYVLIRYNRKEAWESLWDNFQTFLDEEQRDQLENKFLSEEITE